jgi:hypothetical protein
MKQLENIREFTRRNKSTATTLDIFFIKSSSLCLGGAYAGPYRFVAAIFPENGTVVIDQRHHLRELVNDRLKHFLGG